MQVVSEASVQKTVRCQRPWPQVVLHGLQALTFHLKYCGAHKLNACNPHISKTHAPRKLHDVTSWLTAPRLVQKQDLLEVTCGGNHAARHARQRASPWICTASASFWRADARDMLPSESGERSLDMPHASSPSAWGRHVVNALPQSAPDSPAASGSRGIKRRQKPPMLQATEAGGKR